MKLRLILAVAIVATAFAAPAQAGFYDGNTLFESCSHKSDTAIGLCVGYITGVADAFDRDTKCFTVGVNSRQVHDAVKQYLESHPEERHYPASTIVTDAIKKAFCK